jgi:hypothetical protein
MRDLRYGSTPPWSANYCSLKIYLSHSLSIPPSFYCSFSPSFPRLRCLYLSLLPFLPSITFPLRIMAERELLGVGYTIGAPSLPSHCFCHCSRVLYICESGTAQIEQLTSLDRPHIYPYPLTIFATPICTCNALMNYFFRDPGGAWIDQSGCRRGDLPHAYHHSLRAGAGSLRHG